MAHYLHHDDPGTSKAEPSIGRPHTGWDRRIEQERSAAASDSEGQEMYDAAYRTAYLQSLARKAGDDARLDAHAAAGHHHEKTRQSSGPAMKTQTVTNRSEAVALLNKFARLVPEAAPAVRSLTTPKPADPARFGVDRAVREALKPLTARHAAETAALKVELQAIKSRMAARPGQPVLRVPQTDPAAAGAAKAADYERKAFETHDSALRAGYLDLANSLRNRRH